MSRRRPFARLGIALLAGFAAGGCEDPQHFVEPRHQSDRIVDFRALVLPGQAQLVYRINVQPGLCPFPPGDPNCIGYAPPEVAMDHPHFEGHWTFRDTEKPIDVYVILGASYIETRPPVEQANIFWSSLQEAVVGQQRATRMELHPPPGDWVIVFFNSLPANVITSRSEFSAEVNLTYFR